MAAEKFQGVWKLKSSDKFEEYMKAVGVGMALRKMGALAKPAVTIKIDGNALHLKSESTVKTTETNCTIGQEFDEETPDGRKVKSIVVWEGDRLKHTQKWDGKETTIDRYIDGDGKLVMDCTMGDIVCKRVYSQ